jgi:diguanylate cyclase (GGDEF)-like protein
MRRLSDFVSNPAVRTQAPVVIVGAASLAACFAVWLLTVAAEQQTLVQEFYSRANNQAVVLQNGVDNYWDRLSSVRALFESSTRKITREEFENFSNSLLTGHPAILNISWIPRITRAERAAHELEGARDGLPDYHIRTIAGDGTLPISAERDEYFPKFYSTEARTSPIYGLDLRDGSVRQQSLDHIRDANVVSISPPLWLHIGDGDRRGFWAGLPVYARGLPHDTVEERRRNLLGIVQGVFQIGVMIDRVLSAVKTPVRLYVFPSDSGPNDPPIYSTPRSGAGSGEARSQKDLTAGLHRTMALDFGDVHWTMVAVPEPAGLVSSGHARSWIVLFSGLLLSAGLTLFVGNLRRYAQKTRLARDDLDAALTNMVQGLLMFDSAGKLVVANKRFAELFGVPWDRWSASAIGTTASEAMQIASRMTDVTEINSAQIDAELHNILTCQSAGNIAFERTDGRIYSAACSPMKNGGFVVTFEDVTENRRNQDRISHLAHHDALTDLPNRVLFYKKMEELLGGTKDTRFAVLSLDLDRFKSVNDTFGHPIGDRLLQVAAARMRGCVRATDIVARLGGDEFAVIQVAFESPAQVIALATRLVDAISAPYQIDGQQLAVGTSVGIAIAPDDGAEPDQLMKNADLALYRCKAEGGSLYRFFEARMNTLMQERRALELDLRKAVANGEFTLNYQPIVNLKTGKVTTCEALIRWSHPTRGQVPPLEFIRIAEETGLIAPIGDWVLNQACVDAAEWPGQFLVAVNVSPSQFKSPAFVQSVARALAKSGLPPRRLELEITELVLLNDVDGALELIRQLKKRGVSIAMDDFGTGYSSLGYLRTFPFDRIKIDQSFIRDVATDKDSLGILRAVVGLGRSLGMVTTAEGVETSKQLEVLRIEGCTDAQGFLFSQPRPQADIMDFLVSFHASDKAVA